MEKIGLFAKCFVDSFGMTAFTLRRCIEWLQKSLVRKALKIHFTFDEEVLTQRYELKNTYRPPHSRKHPKNEILSYTRIKTHAKGAYKTPPRVSFSMQNRGKLPFLWQFTLFVVSSRIAVGICSILALGNRNSLTIAQKGFLHDKERMISSDLINEKKQFKLHLSNRGVIMLLCEV